MPEFVSLYYLCLGISPHFAQMFHTKYTYRERHTFSRCQLSNWRDTHPIFILLYHNWFPIYFFISFCFCSECSWSKFLFFFYSIICSIRLEYLIINKNISSFQTLHRTVRFFFQNSFIQQLKCKTNIESWIELVYRCSCPISRNFNVEKWYWKLCFNERMKKIILLLLRKLQQQTIWWKKKKSLMIKSEIIYGAAVQFVQPDVVLWNEKKKNNNIQLYVCEKGSASHFSTHSLVTKVIVATVFFFFLFSILSFI